MAIRRPTDDSLEDEDESTALDLGARIASNAKKSGTQPPAPAAGPPGPAGRKSPVPAAQARRPLVADEASLHESDADDEDATEFLAQRPSSVRSGGRSHVSQTAEVSSPALRAHGRAVPLEGGQTGVNAKSGEIRMPAGGAAEPPRVPAPRHRPIAADEDLEVTDPPHTAKERAPPRGKPSRDPSATGTSSAPRVTKFQVQQPSRTFADPAATLGASETDPGDDDSDEAPPPPPPRHRPLPPRADANAPSPKPVTIIAATPSAQHPNPFKREITRTKTQPATTPQKAAGLSTSSALTGESEVADGALVVEVPEGAIVFVNGQERGRGPQVRIEGIDRYAKHAVRIHASGFLHWSGSVCLDGRTAAKVRPALKPKK